MVEKVLFKGQIFEIEILMDLHVLSYFESENHISSGWSLCVYTWGYLCLCVYLLSS